MKLFSTSDAAEYLGEGVVVVKYHYHRSKKLTGQKVGNNLVFLKEDLDEFQANRSLSGRPPQQIARVQRALAKSGIEGEVVVKRRRFVYIAQDFAGKTHIIRLDRPPSQMTDGEMVASIQRKSK